MCERPAHGECDHTVHTTCMHHGAPHTRVHSTPCPGPRGLPSWAPPGEVWSEALASTLECPLVPRGHACCWTLPRPAGCCWRGFIWSWHHRDLDLGVGCGERGGLRLGSVGAWRCGLWSGGRSCWLGTGRTRAQWHGEFSLVEAIAGPWGPIVRRRGTEGRPLRSWYWAGLWWPEGHRAGGGRAAE